MHHVSKILALAIIAALLTAGSALAQRSITVTGKSEVRFVPDDVAQLPQGVGDYRYCTGYVIDGMIISDTFNVATSYDENLVSASGALAPGQLTINASVTVEFELP